MENIRVKELDNVVVLFAGDSGDGMQLTGTLFSNISAEIGNEISTFPDYPAEIRAHRVLWVVFQAFRFISVQEKFILPATKPMYLWQ